MMVAKGMPRREPGSREARPKRSLGRALQWNRRTWWPRPFLPTWLRMTAGAMRCAELETLSSRGHDPWGDPCGRSPQCRCPGKSHGITSTLRILVDRPISSKELDVTVAWSLAKSLAKYCENSGFPGGLCRHGAEHRAWRSWPLPDSRWFVRLRASRRRAQNAAATG